ARARKHTPNTVRLVHLIRGADAPPVLLREGVVRQGLWHRRLDQGAADGADSAALPSLMLRSRATTSAALRWAAGRSSWAWMALSISATSRSLPAGTWLKTLR